MEQMLIETVLGLAEKYPLVVSIFAVMGVLRSVFKPMVSFSRLVVQATPTLKDDMWLDKAMESKIYKGLAWFFDYITSIKLPGYDVKK